MIKIKVIDWEGFTYKVKVNEVPFKGQRITIDDGNDTIVTGWVLYAEHTYGPNEDVVEVTIGANNGNEDQLKELNKDSTMQQVNWWGNKTEDHRMLRINVTDSSGNYDDFHIKAVNVPGFGDDIQVGICEDKRIRGEVSAIDRWITPTTDEISVVIEDIGYNDESSFEDPVWW